MLIILLRLFDPLSDMGRVVGPDSWVLGWAFPLNEGRMSAEVYKLIHSTRKWRIQNVYPESTIESIHLVDATTAVNGLLSSIATASL